MNNDILSLMTPEEAFDAVQAHRSRYSRRYAAAYSGEHTELAATAYRDSFWDRHGKAKVHVPLGSDIAATSADLLFSEEPRFTCYDTAIEDEEPDKQQRLDEIVQKNDLHSKLHEAAETAAALGDVYLRVTWDKAAQDYPLISVEQGDNAWPEYRLGQLVCIHFFSIIKIDRKSGVRYRLYQRYEPGKITSAAYKGDISDLGTEVPGLLEDLNVDPEVATPTEQMLAAHIPNMKPNRLFRDSQLGRSDLEGLRDLMDSLDEAWSSWMRDIRLGKSRTIVPAEYLRRRPQDMFSEGAYTYEFDEDVETLVALDIDPENGQAAITPSQFAIRAAEHSSTCESLIRNIVSMAGYSPQTFGLDINGQAESGTALHIREKKSFATRGKKENYWKPRLEQLMTAVLHLDAAVYGTPDVHPEDTVQVNFSDSMASDTSNTAATVNLLHNAQAASTETMVKMLHPDWNAKQIANEVDMIFTETGNGVPDAFNQFGDRENGGQVIRPGAAETEPEEEPEEYET